MPGYDYKYSQDIRTFQRFFNRLVRKPVHTKKSTGTVIRVFVRVAIKLGIVK
jgi:hypothetical protein